MLDNNFLQQSSSITTITTTPSPPAHYITFCPLSLILYHDITRNSSLLILLVFIMRDFVVSNSYVQISQNTIKCSLMLTKQWQSNNCNLLSVETLFWIICVSENIPIPENFMNQKFLAHTLNWKLVEHLDKIENETLRHAVANTFVYHKIDTAFSYIKGLENDWISLSQIWCVWQGC